MSTPARRILLDTYPNYVLFRVEGDGKPYEAEVGRGNYEKRLQHLVSTTRELLKGCWLESGARFVLPAKAWGTRQPTASGLYHGFSVVFPDGHQIDFAFRRRLASRELLDAIRNAFEARKENEDGRQLRQARSRPAEGRAEAARPGREHPEGGQGGAEVRRREGDRLAGQAGEELAVVETRRAQRSEAAERRRAIRLEAIAAIDRGEG